MISVYPSCAVALAELLRWCLGRQLLISMIFVKTKILYRISRWQLCISTNSFSIPPNLRDPPLMLVCISCRIVWSQETRLTGRISRSAQLDDRPLIAVVPTDILAAHRASRGSSSGASSRCCAPRRTGCSSTRYTATKLCGSMAWRTCSRPSHKTCKERKRLLW